MRPKRFTILLAAVLCIAALCMPVAAYAANDNTPPTINAWLNSDILHIEAADNNGVESVYVDSRRFNYLVDGVIEVNARDNHDNGERISVYAVDFTGNRSAVIQLANPYSKAPTASSIPSPSAGTTPKPNPTSVPVTPVPTQKPQTPVPTASNTPEPVVTPEPQPFTPDGTGSVVDNVNQQNGKEFFTIVTESENTFYLIVDRDRDNENVYLLNAVTESDLGALAEKDKDISGSQSAIPTPTPEIKPTPEPSPTPTPEPEEKPAQDSGIGSIIFIIIAALAVGGAGYYFKILRPKQQAALPAFEFEDDEDMEYEDGADEYGPSGGSGDFEETEDYGDEGYEENAPDDIQRKGQAQDEE